MMAKIKYHQNGIGNEYGADGKLTDNWNPDGDYGNEYVNVHFRIDTKGYGYPSFTMTEEEGKSFDKDIVSVFNSLGWTCRKESYNGCCATWYNGKSHLYLHPQDFSGEVLKNEVKIIAEALMENPSFKLRWVDLYETIYDITDDEYKAILSTKDDEIKKAILKRCKTKRINKFYGINDTVRCISNMFRIKRIGKANGRDGCIGQTEKHIYNIINSLIDTGYLVKYETEEYTFIRTINKTEQKKKKLFIVEC